MTPLHPVVDRFRLPERVHHFLAASQQFCQTQGAVAREGRLVRVVGLLAEAGGLALPVGSLCRICAGEIDDPQGLEAEVVGFSQGRLFLMPSGDIQGLAPGMRVHPIEPRVRRPRLDSPGHPWRRGMDRMRHLPIGPGLLGRVLAADGTPLDHGAALADTESLPIQGRHFNALDRDPIRTPLDTGVRAIDALFTLGRGQRMGLFASAGLGKSMLLGMMARYTSADVIVVGLVGERGREVREFIEDILGTEGLQRSVVIAAPSDTPPISRMQAATYATAVAEYFRDRGQHVLLLIDSLTRFAMAAREVALSMGEPPATRGYPTSVFARLPVLVERTGNGLRGVGSITAIYTVLADADMASDPVAEAIRSFLDGHLVLSRHLADLGHYPAIDIEQSISRVMTQITAADHQQAARRMRALWARYQRSRELITIGAYAPGSDPGTDLAIRMLAPMERFLQQSVHEPVGGTLARQRLREWEQQALAQAGGQWPS